MKIFGCSEQCLVEKEWLRERIVQLEHMIFTSKPGNAAVFGQHFKPRDPNEPVNDFLEGEEKGYVSHNPMDIPEAQKEYIRDIRLDEDGEPQITRPGNE